MPWSKNKGGGYSTSKGGNVKDPKLYEELIKEGKTKTQAAKIANSKGKRR